jgi:hypothetical protein
MRPNRPAVSIAVTSLLLSSTVVLAQAKKAVEVKAEVHGLVKEKAAAEKTTKKAAPAKAEITVRQEVIVAAPAVAAAVNVNLNPFVVQFSQQLRPILRAEYHLAVSICKASKEQQLEIARDGEKALKDTATKFAELQQNRRVVFAGGGNSSPNPRKLIQEAISQSVKKRVPGADFDRYQKEIDARNENRKLVTIRNLVAKLDQDLIFSEEQTDKLVESLTSHWSDDWCPSVEMFQYLNQFFPMIPDQYVVPHLNKSQRAVWQSTQKQNLNFWGVFGWVGGMVDDGPLDDDALTQAAKEMVERDQKAAAGAGQAGGAAQPVMMDLMKVAPVQRRAPRAKAAVKAKAADDKPRPAPAK